MGRRTRDQHAGHAKAFAALTELGARTQGNADPALRDLVARPRSGGTDVGRAVDDAVAVETAAATNFRRPPHQRPHRLTCRYRPDRRAAGRKP